MIEQSTSVGETLARHSRELQASMRELDLAAVERIAGRLDAARRRGATGFVAGNGGSAATAAHWVNDLCKATRDGGPDRMRAMNLTDSTPAAGTW